MPGDCQQGLLSGSCEAELYDRDWGALQTCRHFVRRGSHLHSPPAICHRCYPTWLVPPSVSVSRWQMRGSLMNYDDIDLNLLRVFDVMMRERSVTRAAVELG